MKKLAFGALLLIGLLATGCGGGDDGPQLIDGGGDTIDADNACNPVEQTGCATGEKCTWINVAADLGKLGCVADGSVATGGTCTTGADGELTGFDDCVKGNICIRDECEEICTVTPDSCDPATSTCSSYNGLFTGTAQATGACDFTCNPGDKTRKMDDAPECGSVNPAAPNKGCYGFFDQIPYSCTPNISEAVHGQPLMPEALNGCAPGYQIFQLVEGMTVDQVCVATCVPSESFMGSIALEDGVSPNDLNTRGVIDPNFVCQYMHAWYAGGTEQNAGDVNGIAFDPGAWNYDLDGMGPGTAEGPFPRPETLRNCDTLTDNTCNLYWGYAPWVPTAAPVKKVTPFTLVPGVPQKRYR